MIYNTKRNHLTSHIFFNLKRNWNLIAFLYSIGAYFGEIHITKLLFAKKINFFLLLFGTKQYLMSNTSFINSRLNCLLRWREKWIHIFKDWINYSFLISHKYSLFPTMEYLTKPTWNPQNIPPGPSVIFVRTEHSSKQKRTRQQQPLFTLLPTTLPPLNYEQRT